MPPGLRAVTLGLGVAVMIANLGSTITAPVLPAIGEEYGASAAALGWVTAGFGVGRLLAGLPSGVISDRVGGRRLLLAGIAVSAAGAALAGLAGSLEVLVGARGLWGVGSSILSTATMILLLDLAPPEARGRTMATYTSAQIVGHSLGPMVGGLLGDAAGWRAVMGISAVSAVAALPLGLLSIGAASRTSRVEVSVAPSPPGRLRMTPRLVVLYVATFANFFNRHAMRNTLLPLYGASVLGMGAGPIGTILSVASIATLALGYPVGSAADRYGKNRLLLPLLAVLAIGNLVLLVSGSWWGFVVASTMIALGNLSNPVLTGLLGDTLPRDSLGTGLGIYRFVGDLAIIVGPAVLGFVVDLAGFDAALVVGAAIVVLGVLAAAVPRYAADAPAPLAAKVAEAPRGSRC